MLSILFAVFVGVGTLVHMRYSSACVGSISSSEYDALEALFTSTNGSEWKWNQRLPQSTRWNFPSSLSTPCSFQWQGLGCSYSGTGCVATALSLSGYNLHGSIPPNLEDLSSIQSLDCSNNRLSGPVPKQLEQLNNFTKLDLSSNGLTGSIPSLTQTLTTLNLNINRLTGSLPTELGQMTSLTVLYLYENSLTGSLPTELGGQMTSLTQLYLFSNSLNGSLPAELVQLTLLTELILFRNSLTGSLPSEIGQMTSLTLLVLYSNCLTGSLPTELGQLTALTHCFLYGNSLTSTLPTELGQMTSMTVLQLYRNSLVGSVPTELGQLRLLTELILYRNSFTGSLPAELGQMTSLTDLILYSNSLTDWLPTELGQLTALMQFFLYSNCLTGTLPSELGRMIALMELDLEGNCLTGSLLIELGHMSSMTQLQIYSNSLTGSLPTELGHMTSLTLLQLYSNSLTGSLPSELGQMTSLTLLFLNSNCLTGSLPTELCLLTSLSELVLYSNRLTGSLPTELGQMTSLTYLGLYSNNLTRSLPTELGQMTSMTVLQLYSNSLSGSLPTELNHMASLSELELNSNSFTGTLPTEFGRMISLTVLQLNSNKLTGSLPSELGQMKSLFKLELNSNSLTGSLPTELVQITVLSELILYSNSLTGSVPTELAQMTSLSMLELNSNSLTGSLPSELGHMTLLKVLFLSINCLTGSLPSDLQNLVMLKSLILSSNWFSSHIPDWIVGLKVLLGLDLHCNYFSSTLPHNMTFLYSPLQYADMSMNMLTGTIPLLGSHLESYNVSFNLFDGGLDLLFNSSTSLKKLVLLDVSHNLLSGPLPSQWTSEAAPSLQSLLLSSNCFSSSMSHSFAQLSSLQNLILDAYGSAPGCSVKVPSWLRWLVKGLFTKQGGNTYSLPSEIVQMPTLLTLHAAGNALTGVLPELLMNSSLVDVSLANNNIGGTIPVSWQTHGQFIQFDLSCNKLSGGLLSELVVPLLSNSSVSLPNGSSISTLFDLSVNRLSGNIPSSLYTAPGLNILDGNLFQCQEGHMPEHDVNSKVTVCGSYTMNLSLYMWLGMFVFVLSLIIWFCRLGYVQLEILQRDNNVSEFLDGTKLLCQVSVASAAISLLALLTAYVTMKTTISSGYSTHLYQYGWVTTAAYMHGALPSVIVIITVSLASQAIYYLLSHHIAEAVPKMGAARGWKKYDYFKICVILLCHMVVTVTLNVLYVLAVFVGLSSSQLTLVQVSLGGFKLLWNSIYIGWSIKRLPFLSASGRLQLSSAMKIFTFLVSPYVATFFSDSTCFRYVITGSQVADASFAAKTFNCYASCIGIYCVYFCGMTEVSLIYTSTSPPWLYSYQCSSALLTNYIPVLVISYLMSGLIIPALVTAYSLQSEQCINSWLSPLVYLMFLKHSVHDHCNYSSNPILVESPNQEHIKPLFKSYDVVSKLILNLAVMLSFGFAAPLLAVIVAVDSCSTMYMWRLLINRFMLSNKIDSSNGLMSISPHSSSRLESATADSFAGLHSCWLLALVSVACFWSIFVFDMVGDVYGAEVRQPG